ncbi:MAG: hypothetical protein FJZ58_04385, partial [Chlamydiae bacterium]|nr:hypothetical protein [Chlamydiota bacterium]
QGKTLSPPASFEPGFQVGVGCELGLDGFDLYAEYTWVHMPWNTSSSSLSGFSTYIIPSPETGTLQAPPLHNLTNSRTFQYNIIDLELGRDFFISKKLTLRPHVGGKLTRMFDKLHLQGNDDTLDLFFSQTLSGIGIRAGVNSVWHLLQKVGLYGNIACTGLWSNFHDRIASIKTTTQTVIPILELELGVNYITWLSQDRYQLYAKAGWEEQVWIGYNHMPVQGISTTSGNLSMQGLTLQIGWAF